MNGALPPRRFGVGGSSCLVLRGSDNDFQLVGPSVSECSLPSVTRGSIFTCLPNMIRRTQGVCDTI